MTHRPKPGTPPPTLAGCDSEARGGSPNRHCFLWHRPLSLNPLRPNPVGRGRFFLAAIPAAVIGALLALAGSAAPAAAAGSSPLPAQVLSVVSS